MRSVFYITPEMGERAAGSVLSYPACASGHVQLSTVPGPYDSNSHAAAAHGTAFADPAKQDALEEEEVQRIQHLDVKALSCADKSKESEHRAQHDCMGNHGYDAAPLHDTNCKGAHESKAGLAMEEQDGPEGEQDAELLVKEEKAWTKLNKQLGGMGKSMVARPRRIQKRVTSSDKEHTPVPTTSTQK